MVIQLQKKFIDTVKNACVTHHQFVIVTRNNFADNMIYWCNTSYTLVSERLQFQCMQRLIFDKPEDGVRKIVLATNIAETSITINDVVFVVDCGKAKETSYDALNNTPCLLPSWISKVSAKQVSSGSVYTLDLATNAN